MFIISCLCAKAASGECGRKIFCRSSQQIVARTCDGGSKTTTTITYSPTTRTTRDYIIFIILLLLLLVYIQVECGGGGSASGVGLVNRFSILIIISVCFCLIVFRFLILLKKYNYTHTHTQIIIGRAHMTGDYCHQSRSRCPGSGLPHLLQNSEFKFCNQRQPRRRRLFQ